MNVARTLCEYVVSELCGHLAALVEGVEARAGVLEAGDRWGGQHGQGTPEVCRHPEVGRLLWPENNDKQYVD